MKYLMGAFVKEIFSLGTLLFVVIPFIASMSAGSTGGGNFLPNPGSINFSMPSISGLQSSIGSSLHAMKLPMGGSHGALYLSHSQPIFIN